MSIISWIESASEEARARSEACGAFNDSTEDDPGDFTGDARGDFDPNAGEPSFNGVKNLWMRKRVCVQK